MARTAGPIPAPWPSRFRRNLQILNKSPAGFVEVNKNICYQIVCRTAFLTPEILTGLAGAREDLEFVEDVEAGTGDPEDAVEEHIGEEEGCG